MERRGREGAREEMGRTQERREQGGHGRERRRKRREGRKSSGEGTLGVNRIWGEDG